MLAGPVFWPQCYQEKAFVKHNGFGRLKYPFEDPAIRPEAVNYAAEYCPNAAQVEKECFRVPTHPTYEPEHMELIAEGIRKVAEGYGK